jgi:hypothetical protein
MASAGMLWRATVRILLADLQRVLIDMIFMRMMQMAIMKVIDMSVML